MPELLTKGDTAMTTIPAQVTTGDKYGPAMKITDEAEARAYFQACVDHSMTHHGKTRAEAESLERENIGYYAGYYDNETRERVERLFNCSHPIFGSVSQSGAPSAEAAFEAGKKMAMGGG